jgi:hypothetical protein
MAPPAAKEPTVSSMTRAVAWPVLSLLVIGGTHLLAEAVRPELHDVIGPAVAMPIYLVVGGWAAFGIARARSTFLHGLLAGAALGLLPAMLQVVGFGVLLGHDKASVTTSALFGFIAVFWGGSLGSGIASSLVIRNPVALGAPIRSEGSRVS